MRSRFFEYPKGLINIIGLFIFLLLPDITLYASMRFISVKDGLSNSSIHYIFQDKRSNVWIATDYGLNRITGNDIKVFTQSFENPASLPNNYILTVFEDSENNFWIGTLSGLYQYDYKTETFSNCFEDEYPFISSTKISCIIEDRNKNVWIALNDGGLLCVNILDNSTRLYNNPDIKKLNIVMMMLSSKGEIWLANKNDGVDIFYPQTGQVENINTLHPFNSVLTKYQAFSLCEDGKGNILVATLGGGLFRIDAQTHLVQSIGNITENPALKLSQVILRDSKERIWVGTDGGGLWIFDEEKETFTPYFIDNVGFDPRVGKIENIYEDHRGNIWVSYMEKGIVVMPSQKSGFEYLTNNPYSNLNISDQSVGSLLVDKKNTLWVGTNGSGLYRLIFNGERYVSKDKFLSDENVITCLYQDSEDNIYIGTYLHGFYLYNSRTGTIRHFNKSKSHTSVNSNHITGFAEDKEGNIWISTNGGGINKMDRHKESFIYYRQGTHNRDNLLLSDWCNTLFIDSDNTLWAGTYTGFSCMDLSTNKIKSYTKEDKVINNNVISAFCEDKDKCIWIGTEWGLSKLNKETGEIKLYTTKEGLPSNIIASFELDTEGNLWVSTNNGIARYVKNEEKFINYGISYGLNNTEFKPRSSAVSPHGYLYFAGTNGVTWFNPEDMDKEIPFAGPVFSKLMLFNKEVSIGTSYGGNVILPQSLQYIKEITLHYNQNNFSVSFDALEFITPERIKYEYRLEGLDKEWQSSEDGSRTAVYTNIPPGKYIFTVKAYAGSAYEQTEQLTISILPPWWLTGWAKILYGILIGAILYGLYKIIMIREKEKQVMLAKEHREQLSQSKLQLFTDISHEIRTPLTLVIAPLLKMIEENKELGTNSTYHIMYRNASRILRMVNQMLDIRKIDRGQMQLSIREVDVVSFVTDIIDSFMPLSQSKNIELEFITRELPDTVRLDSDFIDKILYNLLSNAFKYTPKGGKIVVRVSISKDNKLEFKIEDNGKGIAREYIKKIFERFYQVNQQNAAKTGTGIGLHLCKMLVELHHGSIDVDSMPGEGSIFTVTIPYLETDYSEEETKNILADYVTRISSEEIDLLLQADEAEDFGNKDCAPVSKNKPGILVVEDNPDIRVLLRNELQNRFNVLEAADGRKGYEIAVTKLPDLIITDIMMEGMDGIEMTKKLNENSLTRHIPIIMLTAKTTVNDSLEGLGAGADVYINKPFDLRYLMMNIATLLKKRALIKAQQAMDRKAEIAAPEVKSADDKLVEKLNRIILKHIGNSELSIEYLSSEIGISRVHLHRKMKELFQLTPSIYLRNVRLEHAAVLLREKKISISEAAYAVGFSSHQYFTNCFKDYYGMSPAEYVRQNKL